MTIEEENAKLKKRIQELLLTIRKLSAEVPYPEEAKSAAVLIAEVGTLRSLLREALMVAAIYTPGSTAEGQVLASIRERGGL